MARDITINEIIAHDYHRNGVCGVGFHVLDFVWSDDDWKQVKARAIAFSNGDEMPEYYSITTENPSDKWRGDHFIDLLWPIIKERSEAKWQATLARINQREENQNHA